MRPEGWRNYYQSLFRSEKAALEILCPVWVPQLKDDIRKLNRAYQKTNKVLRGLYHIMYKERLKEICSYSLAKEKLGVDLLS